MKKMTANIIGTIIRILFIAYLNIVSSYHYGDMEIKNAYEMSYNYIVSQRFAFFNNYFYVISMKVCQGENIARYSAVIMIMVHHLRSIFPS